MHRKYSGYTIPLSLPMEGKGACWHAQPQACTKGFGNCCKNYIMIIVQLYKGYALTNNMKTALNICRFHK